MKSNAPIFIAFTAVSTFPCPVNKIKGMNKLFFFTYFKTSIPSSLGIFMSHNIKFN